MSIVKLVAIGVISGLISGLISACFAIYVYRNQKWWELRVAAYQSLIEALSNIKHCCDSEMKDLIGFEELTEPKQLDLVRLWGENYYKVRNSAYSGIFLFTEEVNQVLREFVDIQDKQKAQDSQQCIINSTDVIKKCLETVVSSANKELRLDNWFLK